MLWKLTQYCSSAMLQCKIKTNKKGQWVTSQSKEILTWDKQKPKSWSNMSKTGITLWNWITSLNKGLRTKGPFSPTGQSCLTIPRGRSQGNRQQEIPMGANQLCTGPQAGLQPNCSLDFLLCNLVPLGWWPGEGEGKLRGGALTSFKMDKTIPYNTNQSLRGERISCLGEPFFSPPFSFPTFLRYHNFPSIFQDFNNVFRVTSRSKTWGNICQSYLAHFPPHHPRPTQPSAALSAQVFIASCFCLITGAPESSFLSPTPKK